ncbi:hypothetical protein ACN2WE_04835 [Streptomyces sp. cg28]|uniref:hypothetical protein n=1 Tax=Streptomyces sp. cg28 TaxID=3403457 RepID=UPI003B20FF43
MDTDLQKLADDLEGRGLTVARCDPENLIQVTNPLSSLLADEIALRRGRYIMASIDYEVGARGQEKGCADRIAYMLGATRKAAT